MLPTLPERMATRSGSERQPLVSRRSLLRGVAATVALVPSVRALALDPGDSGRKSRNSIDVRSYGLQIGEVGADQARRNAEAIEKAVLDAAAAGVGTVVSLPAGLVLVHLDPADFSSSNRALRSGALRITVSNITFEGAGAGKTIVRAFHDGQDGYAYGLIQLGVPPIDNGNSDNAGVVIRRMTLDGAHFYARPENWRPGLAVGPSVIAAEGLRLCVFSDLEILNSAGYGIGLQNGGYVENRLERIVIKNTLADGMDVKDNGDSSSGNVISGFHVERFGLGTNAKFPYAGVDLMGDNWRIDGISVSRWGAQGTPVAGLRFKQGADDGARGAGARNSTARNIRIAGAPPQADSPIKTIGVHVKCENVELDDLTISGVDFGVVVSQPRAQINGFQIDARVVGVLQRARESNEQVFAGGDDVTIANGAITVTGQQGARGIELQQPGANVSSVRFDVPNGKPMLTRPGLSAQQRNLSFAPAGGR